VEGDDGDAAAHGERVQGRGERPLERAELVVDLDPQGLEGPLGGVATGAPGGRRDRLADQVGEPAGAGERLPGALAGDRGGDA
jgi:hypothetical protein